MGMYYFLGSVLPQLKLGDKPDILFVELMELFRENMGESDLEKVAKVRQYIDLKNVWQLLKKQPLDPRGNLIEKELDEALVNREGLPEYLFDHFDLYDSEEERLRHFSKVFILFFKEMDETRTGFLKLYFNFERERRLILVGVRAKKLGVDPAKALQYEDFKDPLVAQIIAQKDAAFFEFPFGYEELAEKLKEVEGDPKGQYEAMAAFRFDKLTENWQDHPFSLDYLLCYLVQLMIIEDWIALDETEGNQSLTEIVKGNV
ncbi:MAG: hypothetical protein K1060chlam2_01113 [Chlamydiae bacterium]|nr:hypothetical protein [Chlamydiota bacterium]